MVCTKAIGVFPGSEFDAVEFLYGLGLLHLRRFPKKRDIVAGIRSKRKNRIRILIEQAKVYAVSLAAPHRLEDAGLLYRANLGKVKVHSLAEIEITQGVSTLVFLGVNWSFDELHKFALSAKNGGWKVFQLVHDLIPVLYPEYCSAGTIGAFEKFIDKTYAFVTHYLAVSECTKLDLQRYLRSLDFNVPIFTMLLAHEFGGYERRLPSLGVKPASAEDYILFVGTLDRRKNIEGILGAWGLLINKLGEKAPRMIFAGRLGWDSQAFVKRLESSPELQQKVEIIDSPTDQNLASLYLGCRFLLLPSH
ncbi:MAG TPA: hypothetical protein VFM18_23480, partial [Methanosarcina sp.]|nr:hypothetical protein [Methanosarcina sp.]